MKAADILASFDVRESSADGNVVAICPAHNDSRPSLVIGFTDDAKALLKCRAGCSTKDVLLAAKLTPRDLFNVSYIGQTMTSPLKQRQPASDDARRLGGATAYRYAVALAESAPDHPARSYVAKRFGLDVSSLDANGLFELGLGLNTDSREPRLAVTGKRVDGTHAFTQSRALDNDTDPRWLGASNPSDEERWDAAATFGRYDSDRRSVVIVEGLTDAATLAVQADYNVIACRGAGTGARLDEVAEALSGRVVFVFGDGDDAGARFAHDVAEAALQYAAEVRVVNVPTGADVNSLYLDDPATFADRFEALLEAADDHSPSVDFDVQWDAYGTDYDRARQILAYAQAEGSDIRYSNAWGWVFWDGNVWQRGATAAVRGVAHRLGMRLREAEAETIDEVYKAARRSGQAPDNAKLRSYARVVTGLLTAKMIDNAMRELQAMPGVHLDDVNIFDASLDEIACRNGMVNLRTGELRPIEANDYVTKRLHVDYNPHATGDRWPSFLDEVIVDEHGKPDAQLQAWVQQLIGYGITGHTSEEMFVILQGGGGNGKSKFLAALEHVFGAFAVTTSPDTFSKKPAGSIPSDRARLAGARLVFVPEANSTRLDESLVKQFTGGDRVEARFLHKEFFTFTPRSLVMFVANAEPELHGVDEGLWRRVKLVRFRARFTGQQRDNDLATKLYADAEAILAWAVAGAQAWYAANRHLPASRSVDLATAEYRSESDVLSTFLNENIEKVEDSDRVQVVWLRDLWERYVEWAEITRENQVTKSQRRFNQMLRERFPAGPRTAKPAHIKGYRLLTPAQVEAKIRHYRAELLEELGADPETPSAEATVIRFTQPRLAVKYASAEDTKRLGVMPDADAYAG